MRKIFLTTTILLTTGTALAFGGVFNHGSKSTTYKGGVDAIGVHFGGEKGSDINLIDNNEVDECPAGVIKNSKGACALCENGNLYFPYYADPCGVETDINKTPCSNGEDCESGCCSENGYCTTRPWDYECITGRTCRNNEECEHGEYCRLDAWDNELSETIWWGECTTLGAATEIEYNGRVFISDAENIYDFFPASLNNCEARGLRMATAADIGISSDLQCDNYSNAYQTCDGLYDWNTLGFENSYFIYGYWLNDGIKKVIYSEDGTLHYQYHNIKSDSVVWETSPNYADNSLGRALCVAKCPEGTYVRNGECVTSCGPNETYDTFMGICVCRPGYASVDGNCVKSCGVYKEQNGTFCACKANFETQSDGSCVCPENWHIIHGECVECAGDETSAGNNATECTKIQCHYDNAVYPVQGHFCCEDDMDGYCYYYDDWQLACACAH